MERSRSSAIQVASDRMRVVSVHKHRHRPVGPGEDTAEVVLGVGHQVEVVEVDIENGIHRLCFLCRTFAMSRRRGAKRRGNRKRYACGGRLDRGVSCHLCQATLRQ